MPNIEPNFLDKVIGYISPATAVSRIRHREYLNTYKQLSVRRGQRPLSGTTRREEDDLTKYDRALMVNQCRTMYRENPLFHGLVNRIVTNVIPHNGIRPNAITPNQKFNDAAEEYFLEWAESADVTNRFSFWAYQGILLRSILIDGDFGTILTRNVKLQGIESDRILTPVKATLDEGNNIIQGVEINSLGQPLAYHVGQRDRYGRVTESSLSVRIPAPSFIHSFLPERMDQTRGVSFMLAGMDYFRDLEDIFEYEKYTQKMAACFGIALKTKQSSDSNGLPIPTSTETSPGGADTHYLSELYPGMILNLDAMNAEDVKIIENNRPGTNFTAMIELMCRFVGVSCGMPLEMVLMDFSKGNFSSQRAAMLEARRTFFSLYSVVAAFAKRVWREVIAEGIQTGKIKVPATVSNPYLVEYSEPIYNWLDPQAEIKAEAMEIDLGLKTLSDAVKARGGDWYQKMVQRSDEIKTAKELGVPITIGLPGTQTIGTEKEGEKEDATTEEKTKRE